MADSTNLKEKLSDALSRAEHLFTQSRLAVKQRFHLMEPVKILPFYGFGNDRYVFIKGRVMEEEKIVENPEDQSVAGHLKDTYKRYETDEIPHIGIKASFGGKEIETETDAEGFFEVEFQFDEPIDYQKTGKKSSWNCWKPKPKRITGKPKATSSSPGRMLNSG